MVKNQKTILITGGAGFVACHLIEALLKNNYKVLVLEKKGADLWRLKPYFKKIKIFFINGNINEIAESIFNSFKVDFILHLATFYKKTEPSSVEKKAMQKANILTPTALLNLAIKHKVKYFINTGTFFEYDLSGKKPLTEKSAIKPYNFYAQTKINFEKILFKACSENKIKAITLKLFSPFGEKDNPKLFDFLIKGLLAQKRLALTKGEQKWNFTYVKDIALAFLKTISFLATMKETYEVFNIGADKVFSLKQVVAVLEKISHKKFLSDWGALPYPENEIFYVNCDNAKAKKILGWKERFGFENGLKRTYQYYLKLTPEPLRTFI